MEDEFRRGFLSDGALSKPPSASARTARRKQAAPPDDAFIPADAYDFDDGDDDEAAPVAANAGAEVESPEQAHAFSVDHCITHCSKFNKGLEKLEPMAALNFVNNLKVVSFNRKIHGHHDGEGHGGAQKTLLLPSGIVLQYLDWGNEHAPPIVLLHDCSECAHNWDEVARPLAARFRVLALDLRGHGETSWSSAREYGVEAHVGDLHELVVRLSLNGREWGGAWTRPWLLGGKGMGAALAVAYATRHAGRVGGLALWEYDPEWPKARLCFCPYQAALMAKLIAAGSLLDAWLGLGEDSKYLSIEFANRMYQLNVDEDNAGVRLRMDPHFFLADFNAGVAWTQLRAAAAAVKVLLVHTENSRDWTYERAMEVAASLRQGGAAGVQTAVGNRGTQVDEFKSVSDDPAKLLASVASHVLGFADALDRDARAALRAKGQVRYEPITTAELEEKAAAAESVRLAAKEAARAMRRDDEPPPEISQADFD